MIDLQRMSIRIKMQSAAKAVRRHQTQRRRRSHLANGSPGRPKRKETVATARRHYTLSIVDRHARTHVDPIPQHIYIYISISIYRYIYNR